MPLKARAGGTKAPTVAPKRPASSKPSGSSEPKRQRKTLTIQEKVKLLDMLREGKRYADVAHHYGLNESTVLAEIDNACKRNAFLEIGDQTVKVGKEKANMALRI